MPTSVNLNGIHQLTLDFDGTTTAAITAPGVVTLTNVAPVLSVFGRTGAVVAETGDYTVAEVTGAAPLASPVFTGTPTAPTASAGTNTTQVSTTAFTTAAVAVETTRAEAAEALKAPIASPTFTGTITAPTVDATTINVSGTFSAAGNLNLNGTNPMISFTNAGGGVPDPAWGYLIDTYDTLFLGSFTSATSAYQQRFAIGNVSGIVGTVTNNNTVGFPTYRNIIDNGSGDASFAGSVTAGGGSVAVQIGGSLSYGNQGTALTWNATLSQGETDFVNTHGLGPGGFNWYNIADGGTPSTPLMSLNSGGELTAHGVTLASGGGGSITFQDGTVQTTAATGGGTYSLGSAVSTTNLVLGAGAGTGATVSFVNGLDGNHQVQLTTGSSPQASQPVYTFTFTASRGHTTYPVAQNANASIYTAQSQVPYAAGGSATEYVLESGATALPASTTFLFNISAP